MCTINAHKEFHWVLHTTYDELKNKIKPIVHS